MKLPIYLDHNATTPVDPRVFEKMRPYFTEKFGNAASRTHRYGWEAEEAVESARAQVAALIHAETPSTILFTSGATETNNTVMKGVLWAQKNPSAHVITQKTEHKCVLDACRAMEKHGYQVSVLDVDGHGMVDPDAVRAAIRPDTVLISVMWANNEIGTIQPIAEIARIAREREILFHSDAVQAVGNMPVDVRALGVDLLSISGHKMYGPKGIGALYVARRRPAIRIEPIIHGGGHERGKRSGTLPVPLIVGLGAACVLMPEDLTSEGKRLTRLRDRLKEGILSRLDNVDLNGHPTQRLPNNLNLSFRGVEGESLIMGMPEIAVASGSACTAGSPEPSYVIRALGADPDRAHASVRFGLGRSTTEEEVDLAIDVVVKAVTRLHALSPYSAGAGKKGHPAR
ncbi:MAG: IscS subfamily cysteine desulfurase [Deltaproteobacteria bacterium RBG_13_65_10]|jgi:cysteine desulfurase|nr:MAG: IscS subfamily cysteine desulfurase [Deltaproteobacteria bacterium RBG_13_65_10]